jgi:hypothetical protein
MPAWRAQTLPAPRRNERALAAIAQHHLTFWSDIQLGFPAPHSVTAFGRLLEGLRCFADRHRRRFGEALSILSLTGEGSFLAATSLRALLRALAACGDLVVGHVGRRGSGDASHLSTREVASRLLKRCRKRTRYASECD